MAKTAPTTALTVEGTRRSLLDALELRPVLATRMAASPQRAFVVTAVGAGGKTSLVHSLAAECAAAGFRTVVTTTTHMRFDHEVVASVDEALHQLQSRGLVVTGKPIPRRSGRDLKVTGFDAEGLDRLVKAAEVVVIEGDGARCMPFKVPAAHEPVVPHDTDLLVVLAGLTAIERPVDEVCFRLDVAADLLGEQNLAGRTLDTSTAAALLTAGYLRLPRLAAWEDRRVVALNQADTPKRRTLGERLATALPKERVVLTARTESE